MSHLEASTFDSPLVNLQVREHLSALLCCRPWMHYYSFFFLGVGSISSVPLCFAELFNGVGAVALVEGAKVVFAPCFLAIRSVYWPLVSLGFWSDSLAQIGSGAGVHSMGAYYFIFASNIGLTSLQFYWTSTILAEVYKVVAGGKKAA